MMFLPYEEKLMQKTSLDLMFIMDITFSMDEWVDAAKEELKKIIDYVLKEYKDTKVRIAFVGYRDHCDKNKNF